MAILAHPVASQNVPVQAPQKAEPTVTFKASVDLVRISAVVRDRKGRFVQNLAKKDFQVLDGGITRPIADFRKDDSPVSVALLFDVSGSMEDHMDAARDAATRVLSLLTNSQDESAVFTFDTELREAQPFQSGVKTLPAEMSSIRPFGATSLHDAIARTAERVAKRDALRRAVVVFTDGLDNASTLTASEVSGLASGIDVPVYIIGLVLSIDNPNSDTSVTTVERSALTGSLSNLAYWTGGEVFIASSVSERSVTARQLVDELRQQYLIAFEASGLSGWHPLEVRLTNRDLTVRARSGYILGQARPITNY
ncbi:MAG: VWA domain-containing protein [Acidobacteriaceae bacterium]|nr:VWA domain-containing protein [Acidobacteriaceae bacterium]